MMKKSLFILLISLFVGACSSQKNNEPVSQKGDHAISFEHFFENSKRRAVDEMSPEAQGIVQVDTGCTGFFVKNGLGLNLVATATHCFNYDAAGWCYSGGQVYDNHNGHALQCLDVAVGDYDHDFVIVEVEESSRNTRSDFVLAHFDLSSSLGLAMMGYPGDDWNPSRALMITEHCWVQDPTGNLAQWPETPSDVTFTHNCSTYGGNSGGPLFVEGTRIAVGIPDLYRPGDYTNYPSSNESQGVMLKAFVDDFWQEIHDYDIEFEDSYPLATRKNFFTERMYGSAQSRCNIEFQEVIYNTTEMPTHITAEFSGICDHDHIVMATCDTTGVCREDNGEILFELLDTTSFYYTTDKSAHIYEAI